MTVITTSNGDGTFNVHGIGEGQRGHLVSAYPPTVQGSSTSVSTEVYPVTNLDNIAQTWGRFIPLTGGRVRVLGQQIWTSGFYAKVTKTTTTQNQQLNPDYSKIFVDQIVTDVTTSSFTEVFCDLAYSYGYNIGVGERRIGKIRLNGIVVYDIDKGGSLRPELTFSFHDGNNPAPDAYIAQKQGSNALNYPDQTYVVIRGIRPIDWGNAVPVSSDMEFWLDPGAGYLYDEPVNPPIIPSEFWVNWVSRLLYAYDGTLGPWGGHRVYEVDTLQLVSQVVWTFPNPYPEAMEGRDSYGRGIYIPNSNQVVYPAGILFNNVPTMVVSLDTGVITGYTGDFNASANWSGGGVIFSSGNTARVMSTIFNGPQFRYFEIQNGAFTADRLIPFPQGFSPYDGKFYFMDHSNFSCLLMTGDDRGVFAVFGSNPDALVQWIPSSVFEGEKVRSVFAVGDDVVMWSPNWVVRAKITGSQAGAYSIVYKKRSNNLNASAVSADTSKSDCDAGSYGMGFGIMGVDAFILDANSGEWSQPRLSGSQLYSSNWDSKRRRWIETPGPGYFISPRWVREKSLSNAGRVPLIEVIRGIYRMNPDFDLGRLSFNNIPDEVAGVFVPAAASINDIINNITSLYRIDKLETNGNIQYFRQRPLVGDVDVQAVVNIRELVQDAKSDKASLETTREKIDNIPATIQLTFIDLNNDCAPNQVSWTRPDAGENKTNLSLAVPIVMTKDEALQLCQAHMTDAMVSNLNHSFTLPPKYNYLSSGDIVQIVRPTFIETIRITEDTYNANHTLSCLGQGVAVELGLDLTIPDVPEPDAGYDLSEIASTVPLVIDGGALTVDDDPFYYDKFVQYLTLYPRSTDREWGGGYVSRQNNGQWGTLFAVQEASAAPFVAYVSNAAEDIRMRLDDKSDFTLNIRTGRWDQSRNKTISDILKDERLNTAFFGAPGRWEIIQFAKYDEATKKLVGVIRGLRGTEVFCGSHLAGDLFVPVFSLVKEVRDIPATLPLGDRYRGVTRGQKFSEGYATVSEVISASALPFAVEALNMVRDHTSGDITLSWTRRDRVFRQLGKADPISMSEEFEHYDVEIYSGDPTNRTAVRSVTLDGTRSWTYTAAMQTEDGTNTSTKLSAMVYQVSKRAGRGRAERKYFNVK